MPEPATRSDKGQRRLALVALVVATVIYGISLPFAGLAAMMSPLAFGDGATPASWAFLGGAISYPLLVIGSLVSAWVLYRRRRHRASMIALLAPIVGAPLCAGVAALVLGR
jgi:hypothetical protein